MSHDTQVDPDEARLLCFGLLQHMQNRHCPIWHHKRQMVSCYGPAEMLANDEREPDFLVKRLPGSSGRVNSPSFQFIACPHAGRGLAKHHSQQCTGCTSTKNVSASSLQAPGTRGKEPLSALTCRQEEVAVS